MQSRIPIEANFYPRCGTKTIKNGETNVASKSKDIGEILNRNARFGRKNKTGKYFSTHSV